MYGVTDSPVARKTIANDHRDVVVPDRVVAGSCALVSNSARCAGIIARPCSHILPTITARHRSEPIDIVAQFGDDPDVDQVDAHVRSVMQSALDRLGRQRRFPVLG